MIRRQSRRNQIHTSSSIQKNKKDIVGLTTDFDVFLLTSDAEGMPLVVLEAQSLGIPVMSTDAGCVGEMIGNFIVASSPEGLCEYVLELLERKYSNEKTCVSPEYFKNFVESYVRVYRNT